MNVQGTSSHLLLRALRPSQDAAAAQAVQAQVSLPLHPSSTVKVSLQHYPVPVLEGLLLPHVDGKVEFYRPDREPLNMNEGAHPDPRAALWGKARCASDPTQRPVVVLAGRSTCVQDPKYGLRALPEQFAAANSQLSVSSNGRFVSATTWKNPNTTEIAVFDMGWGREVEREFVARFNHSAAVTDEGALVYLRDEGHAAFRLMNNRTELIHSLPSDGPSDAMWEGVSEHGRYLCWSSRSTQSLHLHLRDVALGTDLQLPDRFARRCIPIAFSAQDKRVAVFERDSGAVRVYDLDGMAKVAEQVLAIPPRSEPFLNFAGPDQLSVLNVSGGHGAGDYSIDHYRVDLPN